VIDVTSIINDPDFNLPFTLINVNGNWVDGQEGVWADVESEPQNVNGIVLPAKLADLKLLPEGERTESSIVLYALFELRESDPAGTARSDIVEYPPASGAFYRVAHTRYYAQCLLWYAIAVRFQRAT
jgi:hypothetical protein